MKPGTQTSEFTITLLCQVVASLLVAVGVLNPDKSMAFVNAVAVIAGAIVSAGPAISYIFGRTWLKGKALGQPVQGVAPSV